MIKTKIISAKHRSDAIRFLLQLIVYAVFVFAYYFLVLHFLGGRLKEYYGTHRAVYSAVSLALITAQGFGLEWLTEWLFKIFHGKTK